MKMFKYLFLGIICLMFYQKSNAQKLVPVKDTTTHGQNMGWGYADANKKLVIPYQYFYADSFSNGVAKVEVVTLDSAHRLEYIDTSTRVVLEMPDSLNTGYTTARFNEYTINIKNNKTKKWALMNHKGAVLTPFKYDTLGPMKENFAYFLVINHDPAIKDTAAFNTVGYIGNDGLEKITIPSTDRKALGDCYYLGKPFKNGKAILCPTSGIYGTACKIKECITIDRHGKIMKPTLPKKK